MIHCILHAWVIVAGLQKSGPVTLRGKADQPAGSACVDDCKKSAEKLTNQITLRGNMNQSTDRTYLCA